MPTHRSQLSMTILLTILASVFAALVGIVGNLATSSIPPALTPYLRFAWPTLGVVVLLGIGISVWQVRRDAQAPSPSAQQTIIPPLPVPAIRADGILSRS